MTARLRLTPRGWVALASLLVLAAAGAMLATLRLTAELPAEAGTGSEGRVARAVAQPLEPRPADRWAPAVARPLPDDPRGWLSTDGALPEPLDLVATAPVVVVAAASQPVDTARARLLAEQLRAPLRLGRVRAGAVATDAHASDDLARDLAAWDTTVVVAVGDVVVPTDVTVRRWTVGATPPDAIAEMVSAAARVDPPSPAGVALTRGAVDGELASAAGAAGIDLQPLGDPWNPGDEVRDAVAGADRLVLLGDATDWPADDVLDWQLDVLRAGHQLPGGGLRLFPDRRLVALYGHPEGPALGLLGEQDAEAAVERAREHAAPYAELSDVPVVPAFEIIATIASASAGSRGDYSRRTPIETLRPWVDAAGEAGLYVVLDLQPGRTDFLSQAKEYEELLRLPHVGLALDPEWRLLPNQVHLRQIGSVDIDEVNAVGAWLADLTRDNALPQKLFVLHQFRLDMIRGRERLVTDRPELAYLIHVDGQGGQPAKDATYRTLTQDPPANVHWGWKNFYDEDIPGLRSPEDTMAVTPTPDLVTFQ